MQENGSIPTRLASRPRDEQGRLTAWYAYSDDRNVVDYSLFRPDAVDDAIRFGCCWCCGERRGKYSTYIASAAILIDGSRTSRRRTATVQCTLRRIVPSLRDHALMARVG